MNHKIQHILTDNPATSGKNPLSREQAAEFYEKYSLTVYRVCLSYVRNETDAADLMQETFLRWLNCKKPPCGGEAHETGWLVMTAGNLCKNFLRFQKRYFTNDLTANNEISCQDNTQQKNEVFSAVMSLPDKYKTVVYLYYYKDYSTKEIAEIICKNHSTVRSQLKRAKKILQRELGDD